MTDLIEFNPDQPKPILFADGDYPAQTADVETAWFDGEAVLFHVPTQMVHQLSSLAAATWLLCDGETSVSDMQHELAEVFGQSPVEIREHLQHALNLLAAEGLLEGHSAPERHLFAPIEERGADCSRIITPPPDP
jgi:hypothetical protein